MSQQGKKELVVSVCAEQNNTNYKKGKGVAPLQYSVHYRLVTSKRRFPTPPVVTDCIKHVKVAENYFGV